MHSKQRGITAIGWLFLIVPIAILGYAGIRVAPIYLNYMKVARSIEKTATQHKGDESITAQAIRNTLDKHFDIESINYPTSKDIKVRRDGQNWIIEAAYEDVAPLFSNLSLLLKFDKSATIGSAKSS
jgi:hypothetical protein